MNDEDRILEDIKEILKELDEQGRMKYTQRYMQHSDISVYKHCISVAYTSVELAERFSLNVNRKELIRYFPSGLINTPRTVRWNSPGFIFQSLCFIVRPVRSLFSS